MANPSKSGYSRAKKICVERADGKHVRVDQVTAQNLVNSGGKFIAKHQYTGNIVVNGEKQKADWSHKKTSELCKKRQDRLAEESESKPSKKKDRRNKKNKETK